MGALEGRVALITGAGRGMGREHARRFAAEGASLVVNDSGTGRDGVGGDPAVAATVVAGHLRSTFCATRVAAAHWRDRSKGGEAVEAAVVNVSSTSGLFGSVGQSNYGAAKAGIAAMTVILAQELGRYGVRVNAIVPVARTRMTEEVAGIADLVRAPDDPAAFDTYHPANVSPLVAWLASTSCPVTGRVLYVRGGEIRVLEGWRYARTIEHDGPWTVAEVAAGLADLA